MRAMNSFNNDNAQPTLTNVLNKRPKQYSKHFEIRGEPNERFKRTNEREIEESLHRTFSYKRFNSSFNSSFSQDKQLEQLQLKKRMLNDRTKIDLARKNTQENPIVIDGIKYEINYDDKRYRDVLQNLFTQKSGIQYEWFKEERGYKHWVMYRTDQFEVKTIQTDTLIYLNERNLPKQIKYLHFNGNSFSNVEFPVNVTTCFRMFVNINCFNSSFSQDNTSVGQNVANVEQNLSQDNFYKSSSAKVIDFVGTFANAKFKVNVPLLEKINTKSAAKMDGMFYNAELIGKTEFPKGFSTDNVVSMEYMFSRAFLGEKIQFPKGFSTDNVFTMEGMFYACSLSGNPFSEELNNTNFFNTKNVIDMSEMFNSTQTMVKNFKLPIGFSQENTIYSKHMFYSGSLGIQFYLKDKTNKQIVEILKEWGSQGKPIVEAL